MSCSICLSSFNTGCQVCTVCGTTLAEFKATTTLAANSQFVLADETLVSFQALSNLLGLTVEADTTFPNGTILQIIGNELGSFHNIYNSRLFTNCINSRRKIQ